MLQAFSLRLGLPLQPSSSCRRSVGSNLQQLQLAACGLVPCVMAEQSRAVSHKAAWHFEASSSSALDHSRMFCSRMSAFHHDYPHETLAASLSVLRWICVLLQLLCRGKGGGWVTYVSPVNPGLGSLLCNRPSGGLMPSQAFFSAYCSKTRHCKAGPLDSDTRVPLLYHSPPPLSLLAIMYSHSALGPSTWCSNRHGHGWESQSRPKLVQRAAVQLTRMVIFGQAVKGSCQFS